MALGKLKKVDNASRLFGSSSQYWFVKVQSTYGEEEYWLVTEAERVKFRGRAATNVEDTPERRRGVFDVVENTKRRFGSDTSYFAVKLRIPNETPEYWMLTAFDLERLRKRTETNKEDIEANREKWLADLLD